LYNVQYLRGAAALGVVAFHAGLTAGIELGAGAFGVDVFFVISGFLMVLITDETSRPLPFIGDRIIRVAPLYWIATCAAFLFYGPVSTGHLLPIDHLIASLAFLPWLESINAAWFFPVLNVGWTLNYEMFFYALFAGTLLVPRRWQLIALTGLFLALALIWKSRWGGSLPWTFWGHPIIFEFLAGAMLGSGWTIAGKRGLCIALAGTICGTVAMLWLTHYPLRIIPMSLAPALVAVAIMLERARKPLRVPLLLGDASYSIYLWHYLGISVCAAIARRLFSLPPEALLGLYFAVGVTTGLVAYFILERPLLAATRRRRWRHGVPVPGGV
jgi:exopolysaccharide production protein ExoZ